MMSVLILACSSDKESQNSSGAIVEAPSSQITVVDALGETLIFDKSPTSIATVSPTATEILYAAGGSAILRDRASSFPEEVLNLPDVGSAYDPSIEAVVAAQPDLVIIEALTQARFASIFKQAGLTVMAVKAETVSDVTNHITNVGKVIGEENIATARVAEITQRLEETGSSDNRTFLMLISDHDRNLFAARPESYSGLIAATLGLQNKAEGLPDSGPYPGFSLMSTEAILVANPDVIITITAAPEPAPRLSETITQIPPFFALKAMQTRSIFEADVTLFLQAPGPRIVDAVESLAQGLKFENR
ncbi:ABC transporter substrate-binding protein [SAR202 cluster bacterium AD-802-E10_MRT_200m]|nr:ABC transporter substrate-binding protein [SAR202 cluster bacterium AD-802-E10_MRT_200m]